MVYKWIIFLIFSVFIWKVFSFFFFFTKVLIVLGCLGQFTCLIFRGLGNFSFVCGCLSVRIVSLSIVLCFLFIVYMSMFFFVCLLSFFSEYFFFVTYFSFSFWGSFLRPVVSCSGFSWFSSFFSHFFSHSFVRNCCVSMRQSSLISVIASFSISRYFAL